MRRLLIVRWSDDDIVHLRRLLTKGYICTAAALRLRRSYNSTWQKAHESGIEILSIGPARPRARPEHRI